MTFTPSKYQQAIFDAIDQGLAGPDLVVQAVAGSGKTTTLVQCAQRFPPNTSAVFMAFNKSIADELAARLEDTPVIAKTVHSVGYGALASHLGGKLNVKNSKYYYRAYDYVATMPAYVRGVGKRGKVYLTDEGYELVKAIDNLISFSYKTLTPLDGDPQDVWNMIYHYDLSQVITDDVIQTAYQFQQEGQQKARDRRDITYDEMVALPTLWNIPVTQFDWVLVDECQDLSAMQLELALRCRADGGRMVFVGDSHQAIYGFAGADNQSVEKIIERTNAKEMPLSICYRCGSDIVLKAREVVPHIEPSEFAKSGEIEVITENKVVDLAQPGDMILSRRTAPLVSLCIKLIKEGRAAKVKGKDIGNGIVSVLNKIAKLEGFSYADMGHYAVEWQGKQFDMMEQRNSGPAAMESLKDKVETVLVCWESSDAKTVEELAEYINGLFDDEKPLITLCTIHRAKGLEADRVIIIDTDNLPLPLDGWYLEQEYNLWYVAVTRAKNHLLVVDGLKPGPYASNGTH